MPLQQRAIVLDLDLIATKTSIDKNVTDSESNYTNTSNLSLFFISFFMLYWLYCFKDLLNDTDESLYQRNLDEQSLNVRATTKIY